MKKLKKKICFQRNEITEYNVYKNLAQRAKGNNTEVLNKISENELHHYNKWKKFTLAS
jgi:hypothetical protein